MAELRWTLLLVGILVVAAVYLFSRRKAGQARGGLAAEEVRREPVIARQELSKVEQGDTLKSEPVVADSAALPEDGDAGGVNDELEQPEPSFDLVDPEKIVTIRVAFAGDHKAPGQALIDLFRNFGLKYGRFKIFHKISTESSKTSPVFSVASITEPGSFDLANIGEQQIPGLTLFMVLPGSIEGRRAFESMLDLARAAAEQFDGEVLDDAGITLSIQRAGYIRDEIIDYERKRSIQAPKSRE